MKRHKLFDFPPNEAIAILALPQAALGAMETPFAFRHIRAIARKGSVKL
ncbi:MAG: hypothetical protein KME32_13220 [Mojavia pulchra JT2-VF2]|uniref:Uncharacterized protein n=1 Tax=Mojavia pulchra JT2-VF2 TaxID=287848 RepID=A0A951PXD6_9NOST|nr:hypothetical protein [Mojavia pulchra JT2-VF2]